MSIEIKMPALGESVTEGTVSSWLKQVGDTVEADEPILEVSTDKVDTEVPSPASGVILEIRVAEDETVDVGTVLAIIGDPAAAPAPAPTPAAPVPAALPTPAEPSAPNPTPVTPAAAMPVETWEEAEMPATFATNVKPTPPNAGEETVYVTPLVRKLAKDLGVNLAEVKGSGVGGRIRRQDVEALASTKPQSALFANTLPESSATTLVDNVKPVEIVPSELRGQRKKMSGLRKTIAKRMVESLQTSAQLTTVVEVDVTKIAALRAQAKNSFQSRENTKLTFLPFFVKAATEALLVHPVVNASVEGNEIVYHDAEHIGIAVDTPKGLFVPVIRNCGSQSLADIARSINDLAARTRDGQINPAELSGSTFTITNTGSGGALFDTPIINQPEVAILGVGSIVKRPVVVKDEYGNDSIAIRSMVYLALSYDHRIIDGADAARYLMTVKQRLEAGEFHTELGL